jgi:hypothetical protein
VRAAFPFFGQVPERVHLRQRAVAGVFSLPTKLTLDEPESAGKFLRGPPQGSFGIHAEKPGVVHEGKKKISELLFAGPDTCAAKGSSDLFNFLADLFPDIRGGLPVETDPGSPLLEPKCALERRKVPGDAVEIGSAPFREFDLFPISLNFLGPFDGGGAKYVGMASDKFCTDIGNDLAECEFPLLFSNRSVQGDVEKQVTELSPEVHYTVPVEGFYDLVRFLNEGGSEGSMCLTPVPGAVAPEPPDNSNKVTEFPYRDPRVGFRHGETLT